MIGSVTVQNIHGWKKFLLYPFVLCLKLFVLTIRIKPTKNTKNILENHNNSAIIAFWHQHLFLIWKINSMLKTTLPMYGLISPSSDGAWLSALFSIFRIRSIRGSSKRGGISALRVLKEKLEEGANVAITPDGPRGPSKKFKRGVSILALESKIDIILLTMKYSSCWKLRTWDRLIIPKPFSKVTVHAKKLTYSGFQNMSVHELNDMLEQTLKHW